MFSVVVVVVEFETDPRQGKTLARPGDKRTGACRFCGIRSRLACRFSPWNNLEYFDFYIHMYFSLLANKSQKSWGARGQLGKCCIIITTVPAYFP